MVMRVDPGAPITSRIFKPASDKRIQTELATVLYLRDKTRPQITNARQASPAAINNGFQYGVAIRE